MKTVVVAAFALALVVFLVIVGPLAFLWALNTLFPMLSISYSIETWLAAAVLLALIQDNGLKLMKQKKD